MRLPDLCKRVIRAVRARIGEEGKHSNDAGTVLLRLYAATSRTYVYHRMRSSAVCSQAPLSSNESGMRHRSVVQSVWWVYSTATAARLGARRQAATSNPQSYYSLFSLSLFSPVCLSSLSTVAYGVRSAHILIPPVLTPQVLSPRWSLSSSPSSTPPSLSPSPRRCHRGN